MSSPLKLDAFVVPYKPIVGLVAPMGEGEATWPATSVSLISGERDAVLIDAVLTPEDAGGARGLRRSSTSRDGEDQTLETLRLGATTKQDREEK